MLLMVLFNEINMYPRKESIMSLKKYNKISKANPKDKEWKRQKQNIKNRVQEQFKRYNVYVCILEEKEEKKRI